MSKRIKAEPIIWVNELHPQGEDWVFYVGDRAIKKGGRLTSGRGESWRFVRIAQAPSPGKSGKVEVRDLKVPEGEPFATRVFYPHVFTSKPGGGASGEIR